MPSGQRDKEAEPWTSTELAEAGRGTPATGGQVSPLPAFQMKEPLFRGGVVWMVCPFPPTPSRDSQQRLPTPLVRLSDCKDWIF